MGVAADPSPAGFAGLTGFRDFGGAAAGQRFISSNDRIALGLAFVGLLVPVLVLIATVTRLSAATRERRLAAIRLVGATRGQTRWLAAAETGVAAAAGVVAGLLLFLVARGPVAGLLPVPYGVFVTDVVPPLSLILLVACGVPVIAVVTAVLALRRVVTSPLGVSRRAAPRHVGWWRLVQLTAGLMMLVAAWFDRAAVLTGGTRGAVLLLGGAGLSLVGLAVAAAAVARLGGMLLLRFGPGTASQLADRRLDADPAAAARVLTGAMLVVAVVGWLLGFLPLMDASAGGYTFDQREKALRPGTMTAQIGPFDPIDSTAASALLGKVRGVTAVAAAQQLTVSRDGSGNDFALVMVADCAEMQHLTRRPLRGCGIAPAYRVDASQGPGSPAAPGETLQIHSNDGPTGAVLTLPDRLPELQLPKGLQDFTDSLVLTPDFVSAALAAGSVPDQGQEARLFIGTDGRADTEERVRSALWRKTSQPPMTVREEQAVQLGESTDLYRRAALAGVVFALLAAGLSFAVTTADALRERRRGLAALIALCAPVRVLRRSVLLQTAVPLLLNIALATGASIVATVLYLNLDSEDGGPTVPLPWVGWSLMAAAAIAAVSLATILTLPFIRAVARPEALRAE